MWILIGHVMWKTSLLINEIWALAKKDSLPDIVFNADMGNVQSFEICQTGCDCSCGEYD